MPFAVAAGRKLRRTQASSHYEPPPSRFYLGLVAGCGWLAGIWLGSLVDLHLAYWLIVAALGLLGSVLMWKNGRLGLVLAALCAAGLGAARFQSSQPKLTPDTIHYYNNSGQVITVYGEVVAEPKSDDTSTRLRLRVTEINSGGRSIPVKGYVLLRTSRYPLVGYGTRLRARGELLAPSDISSQSYAGYLARQQVYSLMEFPEIVMGGEAGNRGMRAILSVKDRARQAINEAVPEPQAALLTGILLGDSGGMTRSMEAAFRVTGMTHIIAISGFNIALLIALLDRSLQPILTRRTAVLFIILGIGLYAILVGAAASVIRAAIMGVVYLLSLRLLGRPSLAVASLVLTAAVMSLVQPAILWDIGFQLSFMATLGLMLFATRWSLWGRKQLRDQLGGAGLQRAWGILEEGLIVTLAAQLFALPLIIYHFGQLSLASLPANLLVLPAQPGVMISGGLTVMAGLVSPVTGRLFGWVAWLFLSYTQGIVEWLARMPGASVPVQLGPGGLAGIYGILALATLLIVTGKHRRKEVVARLRGFSWRPYPVVAGLALILLTLSWTTGQPDGRLHVAFLNVGQGDATFIQTPSGRQVLVDGGRYPSVLMEALGGRMSYFDRTLDVVVATHADDDHVAGLADVLARYRVGQLVTNGLRPVNDPAFSAVLEAAGTRQVPIHDARVGEVINLGDGVRLEVLHPAGIEPVDSPNEASVVLRLVYGQLAILLPGDAGELSEAILLRSGRPLESAVLKAGHHGSNASSSESFLAVIRPQVVVISAGEDNRYGHPHPDMVARVTAAGASILRTDEVGTIELISDGQEMWWQVGQ